MVSVEITKEFDHCPCGQKIKEHCYITNRITGESTYVGNVCINRFIGIDTGNLFDGLKRIAKDPSANANLQKRFQIHFRRHDAWAFRVFFTTIL